MNTQSSKCYLVNRNKYKNVLVEVYRLIYFELPKNACTSMKTQLVEVLQLPKRDDFPRFIHQNDCYSFPIAAEKDILTKYKDFLRVAIIRNPWERLVSCYKDKIWYKDEENSYFIRVNPQFSRGMSFDKFVALVATTPDHLADFHFCSQLNLLSDFDGDFMCNYLADLDSLNEHIEDIKAITGLPFKAFPHLNKTKKSTYESYYTPELVEKVQKRYKKEIKFFGYEFGKKNKVFPFGFVNEIQENRLKSPELLNSILREKNKELQGIMVKMNTDLERRKQDLENHKKKVYQSNSWKITAPLRQLTNLFK